VDQNPHSPPFQTPRVVSLSNYYNFVDFVSSIKWVSLPSKKKQHNSSKCSAFASCTLLHLFFTSNSASFCWRGVQEYFFPQGAGYHSYATEGTAVSQYPLKF